MLENDQEIFRPFRRAIVTLLSFVMMGIIFATGYLMGSGGDLTSLFAQHEPAVSDEAASLEETEAIFWDVWQKIEEQYYYDLPSEEDRMYAAIGGLVDGLGDQFSGFVTPDDAASMREVLSNEYAGIGAVVEEAQTGGVYIIRVFEDSPAEKAGMLPGDVVIAVDGEDVTADILDETVQKVRGPAGTTVILTLVREGILEPFDVTVLRAIVEYPSVESEVLEEGRVGYIALYDFYELSDERLKRAVEELLDQGVEGLVLDLRGNGGGYLDTCVTIADIFLDEGVILFEKDNDGSTTTYRSYGGDPAEEIPLVILVDENSASASEILAGAVQDRERGLLVGQTTFGKGSVQTLYDLPDESLLRITTANWFTPADRTIQGNGVTPDLLVELPLLEEGDDPADWEDTQLAAGIEALLEMIDNENE